MIVYLHGLNSSAKSEKAMRTAEYCGDNGVPCVVPTLHHRPAEAARQIDKLVGDGGDHAVIGSSMGGYYATWFCEKYPNLRGVLINPALRLAEHLRDYVGKEQQNYHGGDSYLFTEAHLSEFAALNVSRVSAPERYFLLAQTGDETLDYREAVAFYDGCRQVVEEGGDHGFVDYARHLPAIVEFALAPR